MTADSRAVKLTMKDFPGARLGIGFAALIQMATIWFARIPADERPRFFQALEAAAKQNADWLGGQFGTDDPQCRQKPATPEPQLAKPPKVTMESLI